MIVIQVTNRQLQLLQRYVLSVVNSFKSSSDHFFFQKTEIDERKHDIETLSTRKGELEKELAAVSEEKTTANDELSNTKLQLSGMQPSTVLQCIHRVPQCCSTAVP